MKTALVLGAGGFIGGHMVKRLKDEGYWVRGVDKKLHEHEEYSHADDFQLADLTLQSDVQRVIDHWFDEVYQLAADMGGAGYINTNLYDADVMHNSATINLNVLHRCKEMNIKKVFFSSSACVYNEELQSTNVNPDCRESSAYPAHPDSEYGWEKLFSERLFHAYNRQHGMQNKVARFHNIFGPYGTWDGGKEKFPAAVCRKIAKANDGDEIEIWGDGEQTRSFLYIDDCIDGTQQVFNSKFSDVFNVGSEEQVSINQMIEIIEKIANYRVKKNYQLDKPKGVRGRSSDNTFTTKKIGWKPAYSLKQGLEKTYNWIYDEIVRGTNIKKFVRK